MNSYEQQGNAAAALHNLNNNIEYKIHKKAACKLQAAFQNAISKA